MIDFAGVTETKRYGILKGSNYKNMSKNSIKILRRIIYSGIRNMLGGKLPKKYYKMPYEKLVVIYMRIHTDWITKQIKEYEKIKR